MNEIFSRFSKEESVPITCELKTVTMPGLYAVIVQILSPFCINGKCEYSISPLFGKSNKI